MEESKLVVPTHENHSAGSTFYLKDTLGSMCREAHDVLGWSTALLLINDETNGLSCLLEAAGISNEFREILIGAGVGPTEKIYQWLQEHSRVSQSYVLEGLGKGSPFALEDIAAGAVENPNPNGKAIVVPIQVRGRLSGALAVYDVSASMAISIQQVHMLEMIARHASALIEQAMGLESLVDELDARVARALIQSDEAVVLLDGQCLVIWANPAAERLYGPSLVPLTAFSNIVSVAERSQLKQALERAFDGETQALEVRTGIDQREMFLTINPAGKDIQGIYVLILAREVSAEHPRAHVSSHNARMHPLLAFAQSTGQHLRVALRRLQDEARENPLGAVYRYVRQESLLAERMIRAGRTRPDRVFEVIDVNRLVRDAIELTRPKWETDARLANSSFDVDYDPAPEAQVYGCVNELRDVFVTIIERAVEAQPNGGIVKLQAAVRRNLVGVQIADNARALTDDERLQFFDPRIEPRRDGSLSIGLAAAYAVLVRHGGRLSVRSSGETGNAYQIVLPVLEHGKSPAHPPNLTLVVVADQSLRLQLEGILEDAAAEYILAFENREIALAVELYSPTTVVVDDQAFRDQGDRLVAICRGLGPDVTCIVLAREFSATTTGLEGLPTVRLLAPERIGEYLQAIN